MPMNRNLDPLTQANVNNLERIGQQRPSYEPNPDSAYIAERMDYINTRWPSMSPEQQFALAKTYASNQAIDVLGEASTKKAFDDDNDPLLPEVQRVLKYAVAAGAKTKDAMGAILRNTLGAIPGTQKLAQQLGDFAYEHAVDPMKPVIRYGVATLDIVPETINNVGALLTATEEFDKAPTNRSLQGFLDSYSLTTLLENREDAGSGFLMNKELVEEQARRARAFRGEIYGSAYTVGRGAASVFFKENTEGYRRVSGFVDAFINLAAPDPTKVITKGLRLTKATAKAPVLLTEADAKAFRALVFAEGGISEGIASASLDMQKFNRLLDTNGRVSRFVDRLVEEENPLRIAEDYFRWDTTPEFAMELAAAKTRDEVKAALTKGWTIGGEALPSNVPTYAAYAGQRNLIQRTVPFIRNSRALRKVPGKEVAFVGTSMERAQGARNMINSLRAAGATTEEVDNIAPSIIKAMADQSSDAVKNIHTAYKGLLKEILRKNGVVEEVISPLVDGGYERMAALRAWLVNRSGQKTDFGFFKAMVDQFKDSFPDEFWRDALEKFKTLDGSNGYITIDRPLQMVELLDRAIILPDPRELRRLTRNPLFRDLAYRAGIKKGFMLNPLGSSKVRRMEVEYVPQENQFEYKGVMEEIERIKEGKTAADLTPKDLDEISELELRAQNLKTATRKEFMLTGEQRTLYQMAEVLQNRIWKAFTLATGGYVVRNSIDAHIRMHFGAETGILHPFDYILMISGKKRSKSVLGSDLTGGGLLREQDALNNLRQDHFEFLTGAASRNLLDASDYHRGLIRSGQYTIVSRGDGVHVHTNGMVQMLRQINKDELQRLVAEGIITGETRTQMLGRFKARATAPDVMKELRSQAKMGYPFIDSKGTKVRLAPIDLDEMSPEDFDKWLTMLFDTYISGNVNTIAGNMPELYFMAAFGRVAKNTDDGTMLRTVEKLEDLKLPRMKDTHSVGGIVQMPEGKGKGIILGIDFDARTADVVHVFDGDAFKGTMGSRNATRRIRQMPLWDPNTKQGLPEYVTREVQVGNKLDENWFKSLQEDLDKVTDLFFGTFYDKKYVKVFERSPTYRQFYYEAIGRTIDRVDPESAQRLWTSLLKKAEKDGKNSVAEYLGDAKTASAIEAAAKGKAGVKGGANMTDIDDYARMYALARAKQLLYNGAERNNLVDVMRVVAPFANAWREVLGTYMTQFGTSSFQMARSAQRVYTGLMDADPDQDGRGFFYNDPRSGQLMFQFPASGQIMNLALRLAGGDGATPTVNINAPVKQLSQGLNVFPALGPMAQFVAGSVLPNNSDWHAIKTVLLPYGEPGLGQTINPTPGYMKKLAEAWNADPNKTGTTFANTYIEAARARMASGKYDISTDEGLAKLKEDARADARIIVAMRAFSQFLGPTAGREEFTVPTERGDVIVGEALKFFQELQKDDYDTAVQRFVATLGEDMHLYVGSKAKAMEGGLQTTKEFGLWQLDNADLMEGKYKSVAAYFGPTGDSDMDFDVYNSQINKGWRSRLTLDEVIESAQKRIGSALYSDARRMFGPYRSEYQSEILRKYREGLHERFPGFPKYVEFTTNKLENQIETLREMVDLPRFADNQLTADLKAYLDAREQIKVRTGATVNLSGKKRQQYRALLFSYGESLAGRNEAFKRIWNRLLVQEVDD